MLFACILTQTHWHAICIRNQLMESNKRARILRPQSNRRRTTTTTTATTNRNRERDCNGMDGWDRGGWVNVIDIGRRETGLPTSTMRLLVTVLMTLPVRIPRTQPTTPREATPAARPRRDVSLCFCFSSSSSNCHWHWHCNCNWQVALAVGSGHRQVAGNLQLSHTKRNGKSGNGMWHVACGSNYAMPIAEISHCQ